MKVLPAMVSATVYSLPPAMVSAVVYALLPAMVSAVVYALLPAMVSAAFWALLAAVPAQAAGPAPRVEARSADLLAVGIVQGDRMSIHLSRLLDNAPVQDAVLQVLLRGVVHETVAEPNGGYALQTPDLAVPGAATLEFRVLRGQSREDMQGVLLIADATANTADKNGARQRWWWVLNFAVCGGFLWLWARRRKAAAAREELSDG